MKIHYNRMRSHQNCRWFVTQNKEILQENRTLHHNYPKKIFNFFSSTAKKMILRSIKIQNFLIFFLTEVIRYKYTHINVRIYICNLLCFLSFLVVIVLFVSFNLFRARSTKRQTRISPRCQNHIFQSDFFEIYCKFF